MNSQKQQAAGSRQQATGKFQSRKLNRREAKKPKWQICLGSEEASCLSPAARCLLPVSDLAASEPNHFRLLPTGFLASWRFDPLGNA
jgi:hypothetical protein